MTAAPLLWLLYGVKDQDIPAIDAEMPVAGQLRRQHIWDVDRLPEREHVPRHLALGGICTPPRITDEGGGCHQRMWPNRTTVIVPAANVAAATLASTWITVGLANHSGVDRMIGR